LPAIAAGFKADKPDAVEADKDKGSNSIDHQHTKHAVDSPYGKTRALEAEADDLIGSPQDRLPSV